VIRVRFHRAASTEAEAAVRWYNERVPGLGDDFRAELIAAVEWIVEGPEVWPISVDDPRARRYLLSRFPYSSGDGTAGASQALVANQGAGGAGGNDPAGSGSDSGCGCALPGSPQHGSTLSATSLLLAWGIWRTRRRPI